MQRREFNQTFMALLGRERSNFASFHLILALSVWERQSRLNTPTLTKQPKINTVDWGYNNTVEPRLLPVTVLSDSPSGPHKKKKEKEDRIETGLFVRKLLVRVPLSAS